MAGTIELLGNLNNIIMGKENHISFKTLLARFHAPTPQFWIAVRTKMLALAVGLGALGTGIQDIDGLTDNIYLFAKYTVRIGAVIPLVIAFIASFTVDTTKIQPPK